MGFGDGFLGLGYLSLSAGYLVLTFRFASAMRADASMIFSDFTTPRVISQLGHHCVEKLGSSLVW